MTRPGARGGPDTDTRRLVLDPAALARAVRAARHAAPRRAQAPRGATNAPEFGPALYPGASEAAEQRAGVALLAALGYRVWRVGQYRAQRTQDPGPPDCIAVHPARGVLFWEVKKSTGRLSPAQRTFAEYARAAGVPYVAGTCAALREYLTDEARRA